MPVSLEEKRSRFSSAENDAPLIEIVAMNCSIVYSSTGDSAGRGEEGRRRRDDEGEDGQARRLMELLRFAGHYPEYLLESAHPARVPSPTGRSGIASAGVTPSA